MKDRLISTLVLREGKWVKHSTASPVDLERCIQVYKGLYGSVYVLGVAYIKHDQVSIVDGESADDKKRDFDKLLKSVGLPPYFEVELETDSRFTDGKKVAALEIIDSVGEYIPLDIKLKLREKYGLD